MKKPRINFKKGDKIWVPGIVLGILDDGDVYVNTAMAYCRYRTKEIRRRKP